MRFGFWYHLRNRSRWAAPWDRRYAESLDQIVTLRDGLRLGVDLRASLHRGRIPSFLALAVGDVATPHAERAARHSGPALLSTLRSGWRRTRRCRTSFPGDAWTWELPRAIASRSSGGFQSLTTRGQGDGRRDRDLAASPGARGLSPFSGKYYRFENLNVTPAPTAVPIVESVLRHSPEKSFVPCNVLRARHHWLSAAFDRIRWRGQLPSSDPASA